MLKMILGKKTPMRFLSAVLAAALCAQALPSAAGSSESGHSGGSGRHDGNPTVTFQGHTYQRLEESMTWDEAVAFCENLGGYLACITSEEEQRVIEALIADGTKDQYWLGGYRASNGECIWINGEPFSYANWDRGEPNNYLNNESYFQIYRRPNPVVNGSQANRWNDISVDNTIVGQEDFFSLPHTGLICEREGSPANVVDSAPSINLSDYFRSTAYSTQASMPKCVLVDRNVDPSERNTFLSAILNTSLEGAAPEEAARLFVRIYNVLFNATYRPQVFGGNDAAIRGFPRPNGGSNTAPVVDAGLAYTVASVPLAGARGCLAYARATTLYIYDCVGTGCSLKRTRFDVSDGAQLKTLFEEQLHVGECFGYEYADNSHALVYLGEDAAREGFYFLSYDGGGNGGGQKIQLGYITYSNFASIPSLTVYLNNAVGGTKASGSPDSTPFADVPADAYYAVPVAWAVQSGITAGTSSNAFSPNQRCTNAQVLTFLWRACGRPEPTGAYPFSNEVPSDYQKAAHWAYERGMVPGSTFDVEKPCTRAMAAVYLWQMVGSPVASGSAFSDVPADAEYAQAVAWAVNQGITSGTGGTAFGPHQVCDRGQIVTFLYRTLGK